MTEYRIREAVQSDKPTIRRLIWREQLDPTTLNWRHFLVAEIDGQIVGMGQIKVYPGCQELGSLVTLPAYRGRGIAAALIGALEARAERPLFLICQDKMEAYYHRLGYRRIGWLEAPIVLKLKLSPTWLFRLVGVRVLIMRKL